MKNLRYVALLSTLALLFSLSAFARDKNQHTVNISGAVQVGSTQLKPGTYKVQWQGTGPDVQVTFLKNGKTVATVPGTLKTNDREVTQDAQIVSGADNAANRTLDEIDFGHNKEALVFQQSGM
jgi:hypothetical protein